MSYPTAYYPNYSFTQWQTSHPTTPLPASQVDVELFNISDSLTQTQNNLALIQRADGKLANGCVTSNALNSDILNLIGGYNPRGAWITARVYAVKDLVTQANGTYLCIVAHTSGVFATDFAAGKWVLVAGSSGTVSLSSLTDCTISGPAANQILTYNGSAWVNEALQLASVADGLLTFAKLASAVANVSATLASASDTTFPSSLAVTKYCSNQTYKATGTAVASATTTDLRGAFDAVHITGVNTITGITLNANEEKEVIFDGILTFTHNATALILPGAANITTAAGDRCLLRGIDGTNVICLWYQKASGLALVAQTIPTSVVSVKIQKFTGNGTYTPSAGMLFGLAMGYGAGGGGGGVAASAGACGAGGGSGAKSILLFTAAQIGASKAVAIGVGGTAGANTGGTGGTGGDTTLGTTLLVAKGGLGGVGAASGTVTAGGAGGSAASGTGDVLGNGAPGGLGNGIISGGEFSGTGGALDLGGAGIGLFYTANAVGNSAIANTGAGGGGAVSNGAAHAGGVGGSGYMWILEFCSQ